MDKRVSAVCHEAAIPTPEGSFVARYSSAGLCGLDFPRKTPRSGSGSEPLPAEVKKWHEATVKCLQAVLAGKAPPALPPLDVARGTDFQRRVWEVLRTIPAGKTMSYQEVARAIGRPKATRAVGGACGANPIPVLVPCHRVLAANHRIGGFSGGLDWKRTLLQREGVVPAEESR
jgi:O-6-methylguanine DNA methyltransferase